MSGGARENENDESTRELATASPSVSLDPQIVYYNDKVFSPFLQEHFNM